MKNTAIHSDIDKNSNLQIEYMVVMIISFICILAIYQAAIIAFRRQSINSHSSNTSNVDISDKIQDNPDKSTNDISANGLLNQEHEVIDMNEETTIEIIENHDESDRNMDKEKIYWSKHQCNLQGVFQSRFLVSICQLQTIC